MSLLLDALKRAEQEKLARQGQEPQPAGAAAPDPGAAPTLDPAPRRKLELEAFAKEAGEPVSGPGLREKLGL